MWLVSYVEILNLENMKNLFYSFIADETKNRIKSIVRIIRHALGGRRVQRFVAANNKKKFLNSVTGGNI